MNILSDKLNTLLADSLHFYIKLHNYHWNIRGGYFELIHHKTESLYEYFAKLYDETAERILQLGDKPLVTLESILSKSTLNKEASDNFNEREVLTGIIKDLQQFHMQLKEITEIESCDSVTTAFCDEVLAFIEKELWMLKAMLN